MAPQRSRNTASVGVADHCGWAVLVTVGRDGAVLDRRRIELLDPGLPALPHHHEAQGLPIAQAAALIARVQASAQSHARARLDELARAIPASVVTVSLRACPPLPDELAERLASYRAQNVADTVMYRTVLAEAAQERGWSVRWYEPRRVPIEAANALGLSSIEAHLEDTGRRLGPPWRQDHRVAMAAAIAAAESAIRSR